MRVLTIAIMTGLLGSLAACSHNNSTLADPSVLPDPQQINEQRATLPPSPCKDCPPPAAPVQPMTQVNVPPQPMPAPAVPMVVHEPDVKFEWWAVPGKCGIVSVRDATTKENFGEFAVETGEWGPGKAFDTFIQKDSRYASRLTHGSGSQKLDQPPQ